MKYGNQGVCRTYSTSRVESREFELFQLNSNESTIIFCCCCCCCKRREITSLFSSFFFFYFSPPAYIVDSFADRLDRLEVFPRGYRSFPPLLLPLFFFVWTNERTNVSTGIFTRLWWIVSYSSLFFLYTVVCLSLSLSLYCTVSTYCTCPIKERVEKVDY